MVTHVKSRTEILLNATVARRLVSEVFSRVGCELEEAERIATRLVSADLRGHSSHGIARTARYVQWLKTETLVANQKMTVEMETDVLAIVNGNHGFGQSIGEEAIDLGIAKAKKLGVSVIALKESGHLGCIADWAERAAQEGIASIHFVNVRGSLLVAPFGGKEARGGTSPICCGIPGPDREPIILDFATSKVAEGKVLVALRGGAELSEGALVGPKGELSGDPNLLYGDSKDSLYPKPGSGAGALMPFGLHKGSGLNFFAEVFAGALTGSGVAGASDEPNRRKICNGMLSIFLAIDKFDENNFFQREVRSYIEFFKSSAPLDPDQPVQIPGEKEKRMSAIRLKTGIPIASGIWRDLLATARQVGLGMDEINEIIEPSRREIENIDTSGIG